ncbi:MAG: adenylate/guanylate cyclase domain-containing protein, partial [Verrucomicrobiota bacterium]
MKPDLEDQTLFADQLRAYREQADPEKRSTVEAAIWERFGEEGAVFVLDMSGFSRLSEKHGLILYLSRIHRMQGCVRPLIEDHGGQVVKYLADNAFALFPQVEQAIETAIDINRLLNEENEKTQEAFDIEVSCG